MSAEMVYQLLAGLFAAGAVYGGIRADLKAMHERTTSAKEAADEAHRRIDRHIESHA